ncbi:MULTISPECIES: Ni/Fe-hydrogenase, b-type cytochrome subunit [Helicobacter]|uniref:Ni/Fe-hydrogenase, b-type cytochrome subunit n=4 Tax=Helicobacter typhlonius TaxID=76936 RepID=A0A099UGJ3_9HELI|nr:MULTISPECIES: Ni/Fe-hydrogenase, b-type cytochrome subunit [Helicobacter]TLD78453.1 Ni/Fe-hydrogenase, b-type cytochrome subunit [Helicobacter typhlonius]TLD88756.1 Ni/Fe-hydrogenase, b-type cytochrome subunit [Helicobacter sp. MIT 03-1616]CUU39693.1 Quinone-reactive Ni/Fe hydrogenase, cytochrome b subunit [Helicobacter typhlonius]
MNKIDMFKKELHMHEEFSGITRLFHWLRALCIFALIATGFYIASPFLISQPEMTQATLQGVINGEVVLTQDMGVVGTSYLQAYIRNVHLVMGFVLIAISCFRLYLFFFDKKSLPERISFTQVKDAKVWVAQIRAYLFLGAHPHINGAYNPIQFVTYFFLAILVLLMSLTGIVLYYNVYGDGLGAILAFCFKWVEALCGGLANVRSIHHLSTWAFMIFIPVHIYMAVWNSVKYPNGGVDAMVSGMRYTEDVKI